jgi:hypothetical protein
MSTSESARMTVPTRPAAMVASNIRSQASPMRSAGVPTSARASTPLTAAATGVSRLSAMACPISPSSVVTVTAA